MLSLGCCITSFFLYLCLVLPISSTFNQHLKKFFSEAIVMIVITSEQNAFVVIARFRSGTRNPDRTWSYSLQSCIEQFSDAFPDFNIEYDVFKKHRLRLIKGYENKHCICKGRSTGRPTVLTEEVVNDIQQRIDQSPKKSIPQLSAQTGNRPEMRNHYRGHKMSLWLNLIPQLHRPNEGDDSSMRHHHFQEEGDQYYDGSVREQTLQKPQLIHIIAPPPSPVSPRTMPTITSTTQMPPKSDTALQATTTECPPNHTTATPLSKYSNNNNLLKKLATTHYQSYTTALTVTIAVGCFLLLLNILIFAGIYHQRDRTKNKLKKKEELAEAGSCSSSSGENYDSKSSMYEPHRIGYDSCKTSCELSRTASFERKVTPNFIGEYSYEKQSLHDSKRTELSLQEFKSSPPPGIRRTDLPISPPSYSNDEQSENIISPTIPEPPPPPKHQPPSSNSQIGILRPHGVPTTPGTMKKRVQIQEISV
ncbi:hypothetical protein FQA39_LY03905 [Lamprigera yunnana]|nr:hypothetical protein FQA39_LY03905 [Lamprigera yunnana]